MSRVGERIKEARTKSGLSMKVFAKKLGVAEKYINDIELGRKVPQEALINKASKLLNLDLNDVNMVVTDEDLANEIKTEKLNNPSKRQNNVKVENEVWNEAFASVLKKVPIVDYDLKNLNSYKELPIYSNKIEGYPQDKAIYIKIQDNDMSGFRIMKGDLAFSHITKEIKNNGFFLIKYKGSIKVRQIKDLGNSKILLVSNSGALITETMEKREIDVVAKLERIEFKLNEK